MMAIVERDEQEVALREQAKEALVLSSSFVVKDANDYETAMEFQKTLKGRKKEIEAHFKPMVEAANKAHKAVTKKKNEYLEPIKEAMNNIALVCGDYLEVVRKAEEVEAAKRREEAAEEARKAVEEHAAKVEAEDPGKAVALREVAEEAAQDAAAAVEVEETVAPKVSGQVVRKNWKFEIVDASKIPDEYMIPDEKAIGAMVRAKDGEIEIPGVRVYCETKVGV